METIEKVNQTTKHKKIEKKSHTYILFTLRICKTCLKSNYLYKFTNNKSCKYGKSHICKSCTIEKRRNYSKKNRNKIKIYTSEYYRENKQTINNRNGKYNKNNRIKINENAKNSTNKIKNNPSFKLNNSLSAGISRSLNGNKNGHHWETIVGYKLSELQKHLEKQFTNNMSWENYGKWHIDHIIPISKFNFSKPSHTDFKKCWALSNLQPLWAKENLSKSNKLTQPFQPSLSI